MSTELEEDFPPSVLDPPSKSRRVLLAIFAIVVLAFVVVVAYLYRQISNVQTHVPADPRPVKNAPYIPTPQAIVDEMLKQANITKDDIVYDLGCGDARIIVTAAKEYGCQGVGYDINPELVETGLANAREAGVEDRVRIEVQDIFTVDLQDATVVMLYLLPAMNEKLVPQLLKLKPGARIVCHDFAIEGYKPDRVVELPQANGDTKYIHVWERPLGETKIPERKK